MKNKSNAFLCILMCVVLIASVFVACDSKDEDEKEAEITTPEQALDENIAAYKDAI